MQAESPTYRYRRLVIKLGTNLLTNGSGGLDLEVMASLVAQTARLHQQGLELAIVSSGAIAAGRHTLGRMPSRRELPFRQVLAAVGQSRLMDAYDQLFSWHGITVAQTLMTKSDLSDRQGYLNARNTLLALMELRVIAIANENDVVATDEIRETRFGDNDNLSAMIANLVDADLLLMLTDIEGLYTANPRDYPEAELIARVDRVDDSIERLARGSGSGRGVGGMVTKLQAARLATASGVDVVIAHGRTADVLARLARGEPIGTFFPATTTKRESRQRWILSTQRGRIVVDAGAARAVVEEHKSLLPAGIVRAEGDFERGDSVLLVGAEGRPLACGIANYDAGAVGRIKGLRSDRIAERLGYHYGAEVVHQNNLVLL